MLIECIGNPVKVDGKDLLKDFRLNIAGNNQLRFKANYLFEESEVPVDIVIFNYSLPKLDKLSLGITIDGEEMIKKIKFKLRLAYSFLDRKWIIKGTFGTREIKYEMSTFLEIIQVVKEQVRPCYTK
ncbi:MAG: hypothetical protein NC548_37055 [Lachnospiraceae bacterium]|nr:hypothetical protein [Lachnospiraceae bacterium]